MTLQKTGPFVLLMFTVLCALPAAAVVGVIPSAFAQEEDDDDTNTQVAVPLTDQDQGAANLGANLAANVDTEEIIEEARSATPTEEEEPPEITVFCFNSEVVFSNIICFDTMQDCNDALEFLVEIFGETATSCTGFVTPPPGASNCEFIETPQATGVSCPDGV